MILSLAIGVLFCAGTFLVLQRGMVRIVLGMGLISHGTNLLIMATGIPAWRGEPFIGRTPLDEAADPLPQAFVLTAIVISMATTAFMLVLAALGRSDDTKSVEDPAEELPLETRARLAQSFDPESRRGRRILAQNSGTETSTENNGKGQ